MTRAIDLCGIGVDGLGPRRVIVIHEPAEKLHAAVIIDTLRDGPSGGGVRLLPDLTLVEIARLARAMTYKYALLSMPVGGAKAGIWLDPADPDRDRVVAAFHRTITPLVASGSFVPGPDMGTRNSDFGAYGPGDGAVLDERLTAYGVVAAAEALCERRGRSLRGSRVAIEGFGKVGAAAVELFAAEGARVVAISTIRGAVHDPEGLEIPALLAARAYGDAVIDHVRRARALPREALFEVPCDVLVPGARPDVIHRGNVGAIRASLIVPGSNVPYGDGALEALHARGVVALPDFVSNAGGVLAIVCALQGFDEAGAFAFVRGIIAANVERVMARAEERGETPYAAAIAIARAHIGAEEKA